MWRGEKTEAVERRPAQIGRDLVFDLYNVDQRLVLPLWKVSRLLFTRDDVIHSWAVPGLGVKSDCIPGRINRINVEPMVLGVYYGQCSELCGVNHYIMPISVEVVPPLKYYEYVTYLAGLGS